MTRLANRSRERSERLCAVAAFRRRRRSEVDLNPTVEAERARRGAEHRAVRQHLGQRSDAVPPDERGGEVDGIQRADRERHRFAGTGQYRWTQQHQVDRQARTVRVVARGRAVRVPDTCQCAEVNSQPGVRRHIVWRSELRIGALVGAGSGVRRRRAATQ